MMGSQTKIEWADHTWSPWRGCQHATLSDGTSHPGCNHCYAEAMAKRNPTVLGVWGPQGTRVVASPKSWEQVLRWDADCADRGVRESVFPSMCDLFEEFCGHVLSHNEDVIADCRSCGHSGVIGAIPGAGNCCDRCKSGAINIGSLDGTRRQLFRLIDQTPNLDWMLLTKRPGNVRKMWPGEYRPNVRLLYSASDQPSLESGTPDLLQCYDLCPVIGLSLEPLVELVDLDMPRCEYHDRDCIGRGDNGCEYCMDCANEDCSGELSYGHWLDACAGPGQPGINWVIVGGESGPHARPCNVDWIRSIIQQCRESGVPCFVKQLGSVVHEPYYHDDGDRREMLLDRRHKVLIPGVRGGMHDWDFRSHGQPPPRSVIEWYPRDKGGDWSEWPEDLRVREFPDVAI